MMLELTVRQERFRESLDQFTSDVVAPAAAELDATNRFSADLLHRAGSGGLCAIAVSPAWGGAGEDAVTTLFAIESVARASAALALVLATTNLVAELIERFGSASQREQWLRRIASGSAIAAFAAVDRDGGASSGLTASPDETGALDGTLGWVPAAAAADVLAIVSRDHTPAGDPGAALLLPMTAEGVEQREILDPLGMRGAGWMHLSLRRVRPGGDRILGSGGAAGQVGLWARDRSWVLSAAIAVGLARAALDEALGHIRRQESAKSQAVQFSLADMATELEAARLLALKAATRGEGDPPAPDAGMARLYATDAARRATDRAMQLLVPAGYRRGSTADRLLRDARAADLYLGSSNRQKTCIAREILPHTMRG